MESNRIWIENLEQLAPIVAMLQAQGVAYTVHVKMYTIYIDITGY